MEQYNAHKDEGLVQEEHSFHKRKLTRAILWKLDSRYVHPTMLGTALYYITVSMANLQLAEFFPHLRSYSSAHS